MLQEALEKLLLGVTVTSLKPAVAVEAWVTQKLKTQKSLMRTAECFADQGKLCTDEDLEMKANTYYWKYLTLSES